MYCLSSITTNYFFRNYSQFNFFNFDKSIKAKYYFFSLLTDFINFVIIAIKHYSICFIDLIVVIKVYFSFYNILVNLIYQMLKIYFNYFFAIVIKLIFMLDLINSINFILFAKFYFNYDFVIINCNLNS